MSKKGRENKNFPPIVSIAANTTDSKIANLFKNWAIFLLLVLANQLRNK